MRQPLDPQQRFDRDGRGFVQVVLALGQRVPLYEHRARRGIVPLRGGWLRRGGCEAIVAGRLAWF